MARFPDPPTKLKFWVPVVGVIVFTILLAVLVGIKEAHVAHFWCCLENLEGSRMGLSFVMVDTRLPRAGGDFLNLNLNLYISSFIRVRY